jgi:hypothetical protein
MPGDDPLGGRVRGSLKPVNVLKENFVKFTFYFGDFLYLMASDINSLTVVIFDAL